MTMKRSASVAARAVRFLRDRGDAVCSFELADAIGIDRYAVGPNLKRVVDRGLIQRIRTPGVKQVSWRVTAAALEPPPEAEPPAPPEDPGRPRFALRDWPPDFVPTLHRAFGLADEPEWEAKERAIRERDAKRFRSAR
jgi:hypothetical protein